MGHHQTFRDGHALKWVPTSVRRRVKRLVDDLDEEWPAFPSRNLDFGPQLSEAVLAALGADIQRFHGQARVLRDAGLEPGTVLMRDGEDGEARLPTPVISPQGPPGHSLLDDYRRTVERLEIGGLQVAPMDPAALREAFVDRLAEFATVADPLHGTGIGPPPPNLRLGSGGLILTEVHTRRPRDTVLVRRGYFASTGEGFGLSTPAYGELPPGRYSFGIRDGGRDRFDDVIWTCPARVELPLP